MEPIIAVIGANYGDEGKGLAVDYLTRFYTRAGRAPLVVRGNGGAQAGHTVVDSDGLLHVFGHFGAGAMAGAETYLASNFIVNPLLMKKEREVIKGFANTEVFAHPRCRVTTIYDMALNSLAELMRGVDRHGSCGAGINETVTRDAAGYYLDVDLVLSKDTPRGRGLKVALEAIHNEWVPRRMEELGIAGLRFDTKHLSGSEQHLVRGRFAVYLAALQSKPADVAHGLQADLEHLQISDARTLCRREEAVIYEGAQGLALDEYLGEYPHVTRSVTGLPSAIRAAHECGRDWVQPIYVTRAYTTRHGAGPLSHDGVAPTNLPLIDTTNVDNQWQGSLRYAPLNVLELSDRINADIKRSEGVAQAFGVDVQPPLLFLTCMDQLGDFVTVVGKHGQMLALPAESLPAYLEKHTGFEIAFISRGQTAEDVEAVTTDLPKAVYTPS